MILVVLAMLAVMVSFLLAASQPASSAGSEGYQPELPIAAGFFYGWYPSHWTENGIFPYTNYTPSFGWYSSEDVSVIEEQLAAAEQAHIEALISSWWERYEVNDVTLQQALSVTEASGSPVRWAIYFEPEGYSDPSVMEIVDDLFYLDAYAFSSPAYLRVGGLPVVFVYGQGPEGCGMIDRWLEAEAQLGIDLYLMLKVFPGYEACPTQPDSWHDYNPTLPFIYNPPYSVSVSPGFWKAGEDVILGRDPFGFNYAVEWMSVTDVTWQLVTTWNEWLEGTAVESAGEWGNTYIDILCENLPGPAPCSSDSDAPTPVSAPTSTSTSMPEPTPTPTLSATADPSPTAVPSVTPTPTPVPMPSVSPTPSLSPPSTSLVHGNVDCDGDVDSTDALKVLRSLVFETSGGSVTCPDIASGIGDYLVGDVDCDGTVDPIDGLMILRFVAGLDVVQEPFCPAIASAV